MTYTISYADTVDWKWLSRIPSDDRRSIYQAIEQKLAVHPDLFAKPLRRTLRGYNALRVGEYRIIFRVEKNTIIVFAIGHRKNIYGKNF